MTANGLVDGMIRPGIDRRHNKCEGRELYEFGEGVDIPPNMDLTYLTVSGERAGATIYWSLQDMTPDKYIRVSKH